MALRFDRQFLWASSGQKGHFTGSKGRSCKQSLLPRMQHFIHLWAAILS